MDWKSTGIGAAIQAAKADNKLFVVFVHGAESCENSKTFTDILNSDDVSSEFNSNCVSIRIGYEDEARKQFEQFYPVIIVPALYFIESSSGVNLEVAAGEVTKEKLMASLTKALGSKSPSIGASATPSTDEKCQTATSTTDTSPSTSSEQPVEGATSSASSSSANTDPKVALEERVARAKELLEKRRQQKASEEDGKEKNREVERRELGKNLQEFKRQQEEAESLRVAEERKKDKAEEAAARERVRAQIAQDRAEKAARFNQLQQEEADKRNEREAERKAEAAAEAERLAAQRSTAARVQFRLPDGRSQTRSFDAGAPLSDVYNYVADEIETGFGRSFSLSTTYPRRQLDGEPIDTELRNLGLAPSGTIMVLPTAPSTALSSSGSLMDMLWLLLTPLTVVLSFLQSFFSPQAAASQQQGTSTTSSNTRKRSGGGNSMETMRGENKRAATVRRDANIGRIRNDDDDDEDNNTYNGNSTQQM